ncbi:histone acetyltransferase Sas2p [Trichomonascus vanleenenianus]|uniref:histone acetyltransferase n=1 Tax=Trichomonascus vanleenenianus TaxID=2268995 RepID=UPI003ECB6CFB
MEQDRNVLWVVLGGHRFETWYPCVGYFDPAQRPANRKAYGVTPLIEDASSSKEVRPATYISSVDTLYICRYCFKYSVRMEEVATHEAVCRYKTAPPGDLVYKSKDYTIRRVSGFRDRLFCQCMCLFAKLFLESKTIFYSLDGFEFYVLYRASQAVGFFSRELNSWDENNLACILVFPPYQSLGLGKLLIAFSYQLSKKEEILGAPERPLSKFGYASYMSYWSRVVAAAVIAATDDADISSITINEIARSTAMRQTDVEETLRYMNAYDGKFIAVAQIQAFVQSRKIKLEPLIDEKSCFI